MPRLFRLLLVALVFALLATATVDAKGRKTRKRHRATHKTEQVVQPVDTAAAAPADTASKWVNTRNGNSIAVMRTVWSDIDLDHFLDDYRAVRVLIADSLEAKKKPDETIRFYEPPLYTIARMCNYEKFKAEGYSPRLTVYFYAAAALFCLMLIVWLVKSFIVSPFKD